jgi:hypothetical protein
VSSISGVPFDIVHREVTSSISPYMEHESPKIAAGILLFATLAEVVAMAHHPSLATVDIAAATQGILAASGTAGWVHGVLIALMLLVAFALSEFVLREGATRPLIRAGTIGYGTGVIVMTGAALVSGFVVPEVVRSLAAVPALDAQVVRAVLILCRVLNRTCANAGVLAMSAGIACWSIALLQGPGLRRAIGAVGCAVALVPAAGLLIGVIRLNVLGMSTVVMIQAVWNIAVAVLLLRRG